MCTNTKTSEWYLPPLQLSPALNLPFLSIHLPRLGGSLIVIASQSPSINCTYARRTVKCSSSLSVYQWRYYYREIPLYIKRGTLDILTATNHHHWQHTPWHTQDHSWMFTNIQWTFLCTEKLEAILYLRDMICLYGECLRKAGHRRFWKIFCAVFPPWEEREDARRTFSKACLQKYKNPLSSISSFFNSLSLLHRLSL